MTIRFATTDEDVRRCFPLMKQFRPLLVVLLLRPEYGAAQEFPRFWSFGVPDDPAGAAFPSLRLLEGGEARLHDGSGTAGWTLRSDTIVVSSSSGSQRWTLAIRYAGIPSATLLHGRDDRHGDPEPAIELRALPLSCDALAWNAELMDYDTPPRLGNTEDVDAELRRGAPAEFGVKRSTLVRFLIDAGGQVRDRRVEQTSGVASLDEAALRIGEVARFYAATLNGQPVGAWTALWFHFR